MKIYDQLYSFSKTPVCKIQNINKIVYITLRSTIRGSLKFEDENEKEVVD